jgi:valyl-tRNA synthetase
LLSQSYIDAEADAALERVIATTQVMRGWRDGVGIAPGTRISARIDASGYEEIAPLIAARARLDLHADAPNGAEPFARVLIPGGAIAVLEGVDLEAQRERAERRQEQLRSELARAQGKLANEAFIANAPAAIVQRERDKLAALERELESL